MANLYELLDVAPDADRESIWRAYLACVRRALDDEGDAQEAVEHLDEAWETLRDPVRRSLYDRSLGLAPATEEPEDPRTDLIELLGTLAETGRLPGERVEAPRDDRPPDDDDPGGRPAVGSRGGDESPGPLSVHPAASSDAATPRSSSDRGPGPEGVASGAPSRSRTRRATTARRGRSGRPAARRRGTAGRGLTLLVLGTCALGGVVAGLALRPEPPPAPRLTAGACVELTDTTAAAVPCDVAADGRIAEVVEEPESCAAYPAGWVTLPDGGYGCIDTPEG